MACSSLVSEFTLDELINCSETYKTSEEILDYLIAQSERVEATCDKNEMSANLCHKFLDVLSKALKCQTKSSSVVQLLNVIRDTRLFRVSIVKSLRECSGSQLLQVLSCTIDILDELLLRMPRSLPEDLGLIAFIVDVAESHYASIEQDCELSDSGDIVNKAKFLRNAAILELAKPKESTDATKELNPPPNNFREISILPCKSDIFPTSDLYLRPIISKGSYQSLEHYLDVQFRLYREDCVAPLRDGIAEYIMQKSGGKEVRRLQDVRLYKNVKITNWEITLDGLVYWVELDPRHSARIRWESSKRLLYGSLVCLSSDDFRSLLFAIVMESDRDALQKKGLLKVQFSNTEQIPMNISKTNFTMVETTAYFEAYRHVLTSLQKIQEGDLPFERYIVHCRKDISPPSYLLGENKSYDFVPIIGDASISLSRETSRDRLMRLRMDRRRMPQTRARNVDILKGTWPSAEDLRLDSSQYDAYKSSLTKEFVLIQGPPGTGKTHVGLQIVKTLLHNRVQWMPGELNRENQTQPMLIVCYTNHALDQFMEGIIGFISQDKMLPDWTDQIVRVGGRCNNKIVEGLSLKKKRKRYTDYKTLYDRLKTLQQSISKSKWQLRMSNEVIIDAILKDYVAEDFHYLFEPNGTQQGANNEETAHILPLHHWLGVTEECWLTRSHRQYETHLKQQQNKEYLFETIESLETRKEDEKKDSEMAYMEDKEVIEVKTDADIIMDDRQIEKEELLVITEFDEVLGLDLKMQLNRMLRSFGSQTDKAFVEILSKCTNELLEEIQKEDQMLQHEVERFKKANIWKMPFKKRWKLYRYWLSKYKEATKALIVGKEQELKKTVEDYKRERASEDERILRRSTVIAITTTAAARYQDVLRNVGPKIILVEEAAEVLEAHIVSTLSSRCEHLVLIGDHKQLEPKPAVFELARKYNLSLSMFERMIKNGLSYHCLHRQHRMRPGISKLVKHIYSILEDNENVFEYDHIGGVKKDIFFINHNHEENYSDDSRSYSNQYEAEFIPHLCTYLMKQGYQASQITVLAAYSGQMFCLRKVMPKSMFEGVRLCVLDNYQGEENDIIILSLVRNNDRNEVGFLKRENRTCVALSRAKKGLYMLGNLHMLRKASKLWEKVFRDLEELNAFGKELPLYCQNHPGDDGILAKNLCDFEKAPEGGCIKHCEFRHPCGHACPFHCHPIDTKHVDEFKCRKQCPLKCENSHPCSKKCHFPTSCDCPIKMLKSLPLCSHKGEMLCCEDPNLYDCIVQVQVSYPKCKHVTTMECWKSFQLDVFQCTEKVTVTHPGCNHNLVILCHKSEDTVFIRDIICKETCNDLCENEHRCEKVCHYPTSCYCQVQMKKPLHCGHTAQMPCHKDPSTHKCETNVAVTYPECKHETNMKCWKSEHLDIYKCREKVTVKHPKCNHDITVKCYNSENTLKIRSKKCKVICNKLCENGHCCQKVCHYGLECQCPEEVEKRIPGCDHIQTMQCFENPETYKCRTIVTKELPGCGHRQEMPCCMNPNLHHCTKVVEKLGYCNHLVQVKCRTTSKFEIGRLCEKLVEKKLDCSHTLILPCNKSVSGHKCREIIDVEHPDCGHTVQVQCSDNPKKIDYTDISLGLRLNTFRYLQERRYKMYPECKSLVQISCSRGHLREVICSKRKEFKCNEKCGESLPCGHKCSGICVKCEENGRHYTCNLEVVKKCKAGHETTMRCSHSLNFMCRVKCNTILACGHKCTGTCFKCMEGTFHAMCKHECNKKQVCGHTCYRSSCGSCQPCNKRCQTRCGHGPCRKACAEVCRPCEKDCTWSCYHLKCTRLCYELCNRGPCTKPCHKKLPCGHKCIGYCGEPCPRVCRLCHKRQFEHLKHDLPANSKVFVVILPDCGHEFNSEYIDCQIISRTNDVENFSSIQPKCPICQTIIQWHPRFGNIIRKRRNMLLAVKSELYRNLEKFPAKQIDESISYLKEFESFCSNLYGTDDTLTESLLSDIMPESERLLSRLEFIVNDRRITHQQISDIRSCMITIAIFWMILVVLELKNTEKGQDSDSQEMGTEGVTQLYCREHALEKTIKLSGRFMEYVEGRLYFLRKVTENDLTAVKNVASMENASKSAISEFGNVPLLTTPTMDLHCSDWFICGKGHVWCATDNDTKRCKKCEEENLEQDNSCDLDFHTELTETGKLDVSESEPGNAGKIKRWRRRKRTCQEASKAKETKGNNEIDRGKTDNDYQAEESNVQSGCSFDAHAQEFRNISNNNKIETNHQMLNYTNKQRNNNEERKRGHGGRGRYNQRSQRDTTTNWRPRDNTVGDPYTTNWRLRDNLVGNANHNTDENTRENSGITWNNNRRGRGRGYRGRDTGYIVVGRTERHNDRNQHSGQGRGADTDESRQGENSESNKRPSSEYRGRGRKFYGRCRGRRN